MDARETFSQLENLMPLFKERLAAGQNVIILPRGISMLPMLRQGIDSVVLSPISGKLQKYDIPLYQRENGQYILHRIVKVEDTYTCIGDNQFVMEKGILHSQMIAVVSSFTRGKRTISIHAPTYQIYCRFWHYSRPVRHFWNRGINWIRRHIK